MVIIAPIYKNGDDWGDGLWLLKTHSIPLNGYFDMFIYVLIPVPGREDDNRIQWIWKYTIFRPQVTVVGIFKLWDIPHGYSNKGKSMINYGKVCFVSIRPWVQKTRQPRRYLLLHSDRGFSYSTTTAPWWCVYLLSPDHLKQSPETMVDLGERKYIFGTMHWGC